MHSISNTSLPMIHIANGSAADFLGPKSWLDSSVGQAKGRTVQRLLGCNGPFTMLVLSLHHHSVPATS